MKIARFFQTTLAALSCVPALVSSLPLSSGATLTSVSAVSAVSTLAVFVSPSSAHATNRSALKTLNAELANASRGERAALLDDANLGAWKNLTRTGETEVLDALEDLYNDRVPTPANASHGLLEVERALRFAATNDALYNEVRASELVKVLQPELAQHLGTFEGSSEETAVAEALLEAAASRGNVFRSLESFESVYWRAVVQHRSGK